MSATYEVDRPSRSRASITSQIENAFTSLNIDLFNDQLPVPSFVFQPRTKVLLRWVAEANHIIIGSELADADVEEILIALLHEMVHLYNHTNQIVDCTSNAYHNLKFVAVALQVGLYVQRQKTVGWGITLPRMPLPRPDAEDIKVPAPDAKEQRVAAFRNASIKRKILQDAQETIRTATSQHRRQKVYFMKYECQCPPPHNSIRSGRRPNGPNRLNIICKDCQKPFICVNEFDDGEDATVPIIAGSTMPSLMEAAK